MSYNCYNNPMLKLIFLLFTIYYSLFTAQCFSQGISINTSGLPSDASSILDVSSTSQGLLIPRMTTANRNAIASPALSLLIFNTTTNCFEAYVNGQWNSVSCPPPCTPPAPPASSLQLPASNSITWNWTTVSGAVGYKWNTSNNYATANSQASNAYTQSGLTCNTIYTLYVWAYNNCGNSSASALTSTSSPCQPICSQLQEIFSLETIGSPLAYYYSLKESSDGGYILGGWTENFGVGTGPNPANAYLVRLNTDGSIAWSKTYGGTYTDWAISVMITGDGGYALAGTSDSFGTVVYYLIKTDNSGNLLWSRTYDVDLDHYGLRHGISTTDGGFLLAGHGYLLKAKQNGDLDWCKRYDGLNGFDIFSVEQTSDGGYVMSGYGYPADSVSEAGYQFNVIKIDGSGNITWNIAYEGDAFCVRQTQDGGYIVAGLGVNGNYNVLVKLDGKGNFIWSKQYDGRFDTPTGEMLQLTNDGGYVFVTQRYSAPSGHDFYIVKTDANGDINWGKAFGGNAQDSPTCIQQTVDGGYVITGVVASFGPGTWNLYLVKTDANGNGGSCDIVNVTSSVSDGTPAFITPVMTATSINPAVTIPSTQVTTPTQPMNGLCKQCK
jgi:hypothetical protein